MSPGPVVVLMDQISGWFAILASNPTQTTGKLFGETRHVRGFFDVETRPWWAVMILDFADLVGSATITCPFRTTYPLTFLIQTTTTQQ